jgi:O-antigen/teichoic acid export membrane protein
MPTLLEEAPVRKVTLTEQQSRNLTGSLGKNTLFGIVSSVAQVLTRLVTVPLIIAHLGLGGFGIWSIILVTATYMRFGTVGIRSAFQKYVAEATGNGDYETASRLLSTGTAAIFLRAGGISAAFDAGHFDAGADHGGLQ